MTRMQYKKYIIICIFIFCCFLSMSPQFQDFFLDTIYIHSDRSCLKLFQVFKKSCILCIFFHIFYKWEMWLPMGQPLTELEAGMPFPHLLPLLSSPTCLRISCPKALTSSFYCNPYELLYKIPITLHPWDLEMWTDQTWTWQEALSCCFDFPGDVGWLTAIHLHGFPMEFTLGGCLNRLAKKEDSRPGHLQIRVLMQCWCAGSVPLTAQLCLHSTSWVYLAMSLIHYWAQTNKAQLPSQHTGMVSLGTDQFVMI